MRINKFIALSTGLSRRAADHIIATGQVTVNNQPASAGQTVSDNDLVRMGHRILEAPHHTRTVLFHKPTGYVVSRDGQGSQTIYDILPPDVRDLKPVGRLDKDSSGLLLLTNDGQLALELTHPRYRKQKTYEIELEKSLHDQDRMSITSKGIALADGMSRLHLAALDQTGKRWRVTMSEGRNRQIRRTFAALNYRVLKLHRTQFGPYRLDKLASGQTKPADK